MASSQLWQWEGEKSDGTEVLYVLEDRDISVDALRHGKSWFGQEYGQYLAFINLLMRGDCDAMCLATWIVNRKNGWPNQDPREMDFAASTFILASQAQPVADAESGAETEADPTPPRTRGSAKTPKG
jgi:hypothetical protein